MPEPTELNPLLHDRLSDWGPRYIETPAGNGPFDRTLVEPWNAVTSTLFILLVLMWAWRLRGRYRMYPFFASCLPILLVGGIGGTLFHARRSSPAFFLMDVVPLYGLGLLVSIFFWLRLKPRLSYLIGILAVLGFLQILGQWKLPTQWGINLSYVTLAIVVLMPLAITLWRTDFRDASWVYCSLACFALSWVCRIADTVSPLPMGTHWLWHVFGVATTWTLGEYVYRREGANNQG